MMPAVANTLPIAYQATTDPKLRLGLLRLNKTAKVVDPKQLR